MFYFKRFYKDLCNFSSFFQGYACASAASAHNGAVACVDVVAPCVVIFAYV
jgi:hypothetical protein